MAIKHLDAESAPLLLQVAILSLLAFLRYTICAYKLFFIV